MSNLYFKAVVDDAGSYLWSEVQNWFTDAAATSQATKAPWCDADPAYLDYNLTFSTGETTAPVIPAGDFGSNVTGSCDIAGIALISNGNLHGGTFSGASFSNSGFIYGGTFSGGLFENNSGIFGGTFSGSDFSNNSNIYRGTFTGDGFINYSYVYGGVHSGAGFLNGGYICGGVFTGSGFSNGNEINFGIFSGSGFNSDGAIIWDGVWLESGKLCNGAALLTRGSRQNPLPPPSSALLTMRSADLIGTGLV